MIPEVMLLFRSGFLLATLSVFCRAEPEIGPFVEPGIPFLNSALMIKGKEGTAKIRRGVLVPLGHQRWACFDTDLLVWAAFWKAPEGRPPLTLDSMAAISYPKGKTKANSPPRLQGEILMGGVVAQGQGREPRGRATLVHPPVGGEVGPIPPEQGRWLGLALRGKVAVLRYRLGEALVEEILNWSPDGNLQRILKIDPHRDPVRLAVDPGFKHRHGPGVIMEGFLHVPPSRTGVTIVLATQEAGAGQVPDDQGARPLFPEAFTVENPEPEIQGPYRIRPLAIPSISRYIRPTDLAFLPDGTALVSTFDGDVWKIESPDAASSRWTRIASGLYETMAIEATADGRVFVLGRDQVSELLDLNGDSHIDEYRNASHAFLQTMHTRDYATSMAVDHDGSFLVAKGGIHSGPTRKAGELSAHRGTILRLSPDGENAEVLADGLRMPYVGLRQDGAVFASDQQGHHIPSTPVHLIDKDPPFLGFEPTNFRDLKPVPPLLWYPHQTNRSAAAFAQWDQFFLQVSWNGRLFAVETPESGQPFSWQLPLQLDFPTLNASRHPVSGRLFVTGLGISGYKPTTSNLLGIASIEEITSFPKPVSLAVRKKEIVISFDRAFRAGETIFPASPALRLFDLKRTPKYGSGHFRWDGSPGEIRLQPRGFKISEDRRTLTLGFEALFSSDVLALQLNLSSGSTLMPLSLLSRAVHLEEPGPEAMAILDSGQPELEAGSPKRGKPLFVQFACSGCHSLDQTALVGPSLAGIAARAGKDDLRRSILEPNAVIVEGFQPAMPSFAGVLTDQQLEDLLAYLETLR